MGATFKKLFEPVMIGGIEIRNRIAMAPMGVPGLLNPDGSLGQRAVDYYIERARGGVGLIITAVFRVENEIECYVGGPGMVSPSYLASFTELSEAIHALGSKVFVQLTAGFGRVASPLRLRGQPVSASANQYYWNPSKTCRELKTEEVEQLVKCFGNAAEILKAAGIDGIELHGHEGYLFDQFTTVIWNRRTDKYGGDFRARLLLPIEVLQEIKRRVGQNFPVQYRFGVKHYMKDLNSGALPGEKFVEAGRDIEEGLKTAEMLEKAGFDALNVDAGCYDSWYWPHPPIYQEHGYMIEMTKEVKKLVKIPVIGAGRLEIPELAEQVIAEGKADMIAIGRGLLTDPFWVKKVEEGQPDHIRPCIGCHDACMGRLVAGKPLSCAVNPAVGRERIYKIERSDKPKNVAIVGSGIAGLEAARISSLRGHRVTVYEEANSIGGHLIEASIPGFKKDLARLLDWYKVELKELDLEIKSGTKVSPEVIEHEKPDVVIIATGSKPIIPDIPGIKKDKVVTSIDLLLGKKRAQNKVLVLGGGLIGCETALWLAQQGKEVTIVEVLNDLMVAGIPVQRMNKLMLTDLLKLWKVNVITNTSVLEICEETTLLIDNVFRRKGLDADTVVLALGLRPNQELYKALRSKTPNLFLIGDARESRNIMGSIWDAYEVARMI